MFRSAALCVALVLGLSACKQADAKDFSELYAATDIAFAKCEHEAGTLTSQIDWDQLNRADQYCSMAIAGFYGLSHDPDAEALAKWMAENPDKASIGDIDRWSRSIELVNALVAYVGPENLPALSAVAKRLQELEARQKPI